MSGEGHRDFWSIVIGLFVAAAVMYAQHNSPLAARAEFVQRAVSDRAVIVQELNVLRLEFGRMYASVRRTVRIC
jgi:hypothetical protein